MFKGFKLVLGGTCIYRHALPKGYILKKDRKKLEEQSRLDQISLEELIENEVFYCIFCYLGWKIPIQKF